MLRNVCFSLKLKPICLLNRAAISKTKTTAGTKIKTIPLIDLKKYEQEENEKILDVINLSTKIEDLLK